MSPAAPVATGLSAESVASPPAAIPAATTGRAARARPLILAVDDAEEILSLIGATLEDDYDLVYAHDGVEALEMVATYSPDALALDVMMPRMSGYEVCKRLKDDPATADIPVLILSARGDAAHIKEGFHVGADDYLPKPFDPEEMELRLRAMLRRAGRLPR
jgi:DNA-binding response OmpR family regulator